MAGFKSSANYDHLTLAILPTPKSGLMEVHVLLVRKKRSLFMVRLICPENLKMPLHCLPEMMSMFFPIAAFVGIPQGNQVVGYNVLVGGD